MIGHSMLQHCNLDRNLSQLQWSQPCSLIRAEICGRNKLHSHAIFSQNYSTFGWRTRGNLGMPHIKNWVLKSVLKCINFQIWRSNHLDVVLIKTTVKNMFYVTGGKILVLSPKMNNTQTCLAMSETKSFLHSLGYIDCMMYHVNTTQNCKLRIDPVTRMTFPFVNKQAHTHTKCIAALNLRGGHFQFHRM